MTTGACLFTTIAFLYSPRRQMPFLVTCIVTFFSIESIELLKERRSAQSAYLFEAH